MTEEISNQAKQQLAIQLDQAPMAGERIIEHLLNGQVILQKKNAELEAKLDKVLDQLLLITRLVDVHEAALEKVGIMKVARESEKGSLVN
jgi:hypothetical protein